MQLRSFWPRSPAPAAACLGVLAVLWGCSSPSSPGGPEPPPPTPDAAVLVGAGDIAVCNSPGTEATARLIDGIAGSVFTAGDNAYQNGDPLDFSECYDPSWGRFRDRTFPVPGNHDYEDRPNHDGHGYFDYFGDAAGPRGLGYYAYNVGTWRVVTLNSEVLTAGRVPNAGAASAQLAWLTNELSSTKAPCTIAIWHRPLYSSGQNRPNPDTRDLFKKLYDFNADLVINGHDHDYERFGPQDADGHADAARGIRQFIVGTGGVEPYTFFSKQPNSETFQSNTWGVLKLTLSTGSYEWEYIPVAGRGTRDTGNGVCH
jgi:hypothetical protein